MPSPLKKRSFAAELLEQQKKGISPALIVIIAGVVVIAAIGGYYFYSRYAAKEISAPAAEKIITIAVLPFENVSADEEQEYFCNGVSEEILNALTRVEGLSVIARTSSFAFKGQNKSIREIGKELGAEWIVEGSVRKSDSKIRITAQLIKASDQTHLFSETYDRELKEIFAVQDEISLAVVEKLKGGLLSGEKAAITKRGTDDIDAYDLYLLGIHSIARGGEGARDKALDMFRKALDRDPDYALAIAGIADTYSKMGYHQILPPKEAYPMAKKEAKRALEIDEELPEAHAVLGWIGIYYDWDWPEAERRLKRAIELNPSFAAAHHNYRDYLMIMGRWDEAIAEMELAQKLDPMTQWYKGLVIFTYIVARRYEEAREKINEAGELLAEDKLWSALLKYNISMYSDKVNYTEAINAAEIIRQVRDDALGLSFLARAYGKAGDLEKAEQIIKELLDKHGEDGITSYFWAMVYYDLGDYDRAFEWLEKAYEERDSWLPYIKSFHQWEPIRSDPRYTALVKKMGLE